MAKKKVLIITTRFPYPLDKGDKLRIYHQISLLSKNYEIGLVTFSNEKVSAESRQEVDKYVTEMMILDESIYDRGFRVARRLGSRLPAQVRYFYNSRWKKKVDSFIKNFSPDLVYCHLARSYPYVEDANAPIVVDLMDCFSAIATRRANLYKGPERWFWLAEAKKMRRLESTIIRDTEIQTLISNQEIERLPPPHTSSLRVIKNGIDSEVFRFRPVPKLYDLLFVGNLSYYPNKLAVEYLCEKILPEISIARPSITVGIFGADPDPATERFNALSGVTVGGWTDDIVRIYNEGKILVAPLFTGGGMQNKILEALSCGLPVVTTEQVENAFEDLDDIIFTAKNPKQFTSQILRLLDNPTMYKEIRNKGIDRIKQNYTWEAENEKLKDIFEVIIENHD